MTDGDVIEVTLRGFDPRVSAEVGPPVMGPPGLRGPVGEKGEPGGTTVIVFAFGEERRPDELPEDGLIPSGWDGVRRPEAPIQVAVGQSVEHVADGYLWLFLGPASIPGGWLETGQLRGPPGERGPMGDQGLTGPPGERGLQGSPGAPGPQGPRGDSGPQGARGETGPAGPVGATGVQGPRGDPGRDGTDGTDGAPGPEGPRGEQGDQGDPGGPSFIIAMFINRTAPELASLQNGLIPAHWDRPNVPPADYQMQVGEAWLHGNPAETQYYGQAIVFVGATPNTGAPWIPMVVTGPQGFPGDQGPQGGEGPQGATGPRGEAGSRWHWSPVDPPQVGNQNDVPGDYILVMFPGAGDQESAAHGNVYLSVIGGSYNLQGNIRGPRGLQGVQGPPGEVSQAQHDALALRVTRLESVVTQSLSSDVNMVDNADTVIQSIPLAVGEHIGQGTFTFELDRAADPSATSRLVTMWCDPSGPVVLTGHRAGQLYLHQALPMGSLSFGPMRAVVSGPGNIVVYYRVSQPPGDSGPQTGRVIAKATTTIGAHPGASGFLAR